MAGHRDRIKFLRPVPSDIDIANAVEPLKIKQIAEEAGVNEEELDL